MSERGPLPNFIIGGAPRSGTTYLASALDRHPDIYIIKPFVPEPKTFVAHDLDEAALAAHYARLFNGRQNERLLGEKTSYYLENEQACRLIKKRLPQIRLIFIVREPVARAYSNYRWSVKNGLENLSFEEAISLEGDRKSPLAPDKAYARPYDYLGRGDYALFARRYFEAFGREQVFFCLYEDLAAEPEKIFSDLQGFLGVEEIPWTTLDVGQVEYIKAPGPSLTAETETRLRARMAPRVEEFGRVSGLDLSAWGY